MKRIFIAVSVFVVVRLVVEILHCHTGAKCQFNSSLNWQQYLMGGLIVLAMLAGAGFFIVIAIDCLVRILPRNRSVPAILAVGMWSGIVGLVPELIGAALSGNSISGFRWRIAHTYQFLCGCCCGGYLLLTTPRR